MMLLLRTPLAVAAGGIVGSLARWGFLSIPDNRTAVATLGLNVAGSLLLGVVIAQRDRLTDAQFHLLGTGFAGGLTTFSTFAVTVARQLEDGRLLDAVANGSGTLVLALVAAGIGYRIGRLSG